MKLKHSKKHSTQGGALIASMVVVGVTSIGFGLLTNLLGQRSYNTENTRAVMGRHIAEISSQQMLRSYMSNKTLTSSGGSLADVSGGGGGGAAPPNKILDNEGAVLGGISIENWTGPPMQSVDTAVREYNPFAPAGADKAFAKVIQGTVMFPTKNSSVAEKFTDNTKKNRSKNFAGAAMSRSPLLGSYQLVLHQPSYTAPYTITGKVQVNGGLMAFPTSPTFLTVKARLRHFRELPGTYTADVPANAYVPSNLPTPTLSSGKIGGANDFSGKLSVISDSANGGNNIVARLIHTGPIDVHQIDGNLAATPHGVTINTTTGAMTVDLTNNLLNHVVVTNHISEISITGASAATGDDMRAVALIYLQNAATTMDLTKVTFTNNVNKRRFLFCIRKDPAANTNGSAVNFEYPTSISLPEWRSIFVLERTPITILPTGGGGRITITGGIQTNAGINFPSASFFLIKRENQPLYLNRYTPRMVWSEINPKNDTLVNNPVIPD